MQDQASNPGAGLIEQLQDIHSAAEPSLWPPAPGWWVLGAIALTILVIILVRVTSNIRVQIRRRRLLAELDGLALNFDPRQSPADYLAALNRLFRGVALRAFPNSGCARLEGEAWVSFVRERLKTHGDVPELSVLESGPYQRDPDFDPERLQACARQWVLSYG
jgi:hypothetical protein